MAPALPVTGEPRKQQRAAQRQLLAADRGFLRRREYDDGKRPNAAEEVDTTPEVVATY
jgi:hypothetical protein